MYKFALFFPRTLELQKFIRISQEINKFKEK